MRKKIVALVLLTVILATLLAGCAMFPVDEDRDYHTVVANVQYKGMTDQVYKGELMNVLGNYGAAFVQNYGWTYEQVAEYFLGTLAKQKLMVLYAKEYVANNGVGGISIVTDSNAIANMPNADFLTVDERRHCIELTNKSFRDSLDSIIKAREEEQSANEDADTDKKEEETEEEELAARPSRPKAQESDEYVNQYMTDATLLPKSLLETYKNEIKNAEKDKKKNMKYALDTLNKNIKSQYMTYDKYVDQYYESQIVSKYEKAIGEKIEISQDEINKSITKLQLTDAKKYIKEEDYSKAVGEKDAFLYHHTNKGYFNVRSILLKFNEEQTSALASFSGINVGNDEAIAKFKENLALNLATNQFTQAGIKVNVSNPKYDSEVDELKDAYTDKDIDWTVVMYAMAEDIANKVNIVKDYINAQGDKYTAIQKELIIQQAQKLAFEDWIYLVNDDSGMFSNPSYAVTRDGMASSYVEEYTVLARELFKQNDTKSVGYMTVDGVNTSVTTNEEMTYSGTTDILKVANGAKYTLNSSARVLKDENNKDIKATVFNFVTDNGNELSFIVNNFGIHIVMVDSIALNEQYGQDTITGSEEEGWTIQGGYVFSQDITIEYVKDEEGNDTQDIKDIQIEITTVADKVKENLNKQQVADMSTNLQIELFNNSEYIKNVDKAYKNIIKMFK